MSFKVDIAPLTPAASIRLTSSYYLIGVEGGTAISSLACRDGEPNTVGEVLGLELGEVGVVGVNGLIEGAEGPEPKDARESEDAPADHHTYIL